MVEDKEEKRKERENEILQLLCDVRLWREE